MGDIETGRPLPDDLLASLVQTRDGQSVELGSLIQAKRTALVFIRHFGCLGCSVHMAELAPRLDELGKLGLEVVIVGNGAVRYVDGFIERFHLDEKHVPVVTDPTLKTHRAARLKRSFWATLGPKGLYDQICALIRGHAQRGVQATTGSREARSFSTRTEASSTTTETIRSAITRPRAISSTVSTSCSCTGIRSIRVELMDWLLHIANVLYLFSYSVRDIMALRILTVVAASCLLPYFFFQPEPLYAAIAWNVLFTVMNLYRIVLLYRERQPVYFDEKENELYRAAFPSLTSQQFARLLKIAQWKDSKSKDCLFDTGAVIDQFIALNSGLVDIQKNGSVLAQRAKGDFVGETCLLTDEPITARVVVNEDAHYATWPRDELERLLDEDPQLHASLQKDISHSLIRKLEAA